MFCPKCGAQVADSSSFCPSCGNPLTVQNNQSSAPYYQNTAPNYQNTAPSYQDYQNTAPNYQGSAPSYQDTAPGYQNTAPGYRGPSPEGQYSAPAYNAGYGSAAAPNLNQSQGMGWYKFIINFLLFASAVLNTILGILYLTGGVYDASAGDTYTYYFSSAAEMVYAVFPDLKPLDVVYGLFALAMAGFAIYTRVRLKNFCKNGPKCLYALYGAGLAISLLYIIIASSIINSSAFDASTTGSIVGSLTMLIINIVYFGKRKHMFVND